MLTRGFGDRTATVDLLGRKSIINTTAELLRPASATDSDVGPNVLTAINVFLSDTLPRTRFVLGLDPAVVASHVDHAYKELADAKVVAHPDDPSPGWTFLRKLVQLPIRLPRTTTDNVNRVLDAHLGPAHLAKTIPVAQPGMATTTVVRATITAEPEPAQPLPRHAIEAPVIAIERHPDVRAYLHRRLTAQPEESIREEKRLLDVWQFYLRVLAAPDIKRACHEEAATNLRALLRDCDAQAVAALAERLL